LPGEAAAKDKANAEKLAKVDAVKEKMRLKAKGFVPNKKLGGFVFPGIDPKIIRKALRKKKRTKKKKVKPPPEPGMAIGPIATNGSIGVDFNVDMIAPAAIN
jgi:hypothetical protein